MAYWLRAGCAWRLLPHDLPPWQTVYHYFRYWRLDGTWERMHSALRERVRVRLKRNSQPSAGIVDSRSARTSGVGGQERGFDPAKQVEGRKRHLLVDTEGLVMKVRVHSAKVVDQDGTSSCQSPPYPIARPASPTCGWTPDGCKAYWAGVPRSLGIRPSRHPRR